MTDICQQCGEYEGAQIANHWSSPSTDCRHPSFSEHQREIIIGLLMGDGSINTSSKNPSLQARMISPNYLKYVDEQLGIFGNGVSMVITAEENARQKRETGFRPDAKAKNYSDLYHWHSMQHNELKEFERWYSTGNKIWPADIILTPTVLKHWYCGDGSFNNSKRNNSIKISMSNERENTKKIDRMFENSNIPVPSNYNTSERQSGGKRCNAEFTIEQSKELWKYMGEPLPDFEYKWPEEYRKV